MTKKPPDRPCWRCGYVLRGEEAQRFRDRGWLNARCPECGAWIALRGPPIGTKVRRRREREVS